jgi:phage shock protein PspC (stress-responsive transcriptional regulator)
MNEVTQIHLGRQPFTISAEAHKALRDYLSAIRKQVDDKEVVEEVELRMAELLAENGITGDKVVLMKDVDYLKEQLGDPKDFKEDSDSTSDTGVSDQGQKRLFRDTDNAMLAGVAAGLANYLGVDVLLIRILFVIGVLTGGWGLLLYIALWLLVPEAKSSSDRLQMMGRSVTVEALKEVVERTDIKGAAHRANGTIVPVLNTIFRIFLKVSGVIFILAGLSIILGLIAAKTYMLMHAGRLFQENLFPVGTAEHLLMDIGMILAGIVALFIVLFGMAIFRRKWPIRTWITGVLIGLFFIGLAAGIALAGDAAPKVRDRYSAATHTTTRSLAPFNSVTAVGDGVDVQYEYSDKYSVSLNYFDNPDLSKIKTTVVNGTLQIDSKQFDWRRKCDMLCMFPTYNMVLTIKAPNALSIDRFDSPPIFLPNSPPLYYR